MEKQGTHTGKEQGGLNIQRQAVLLYQDGHQNGGAKHGKHVLQAQNQHLGRAQLPGVTDGFVRTHFHFSLLKHTQKKTITPVIVLQYEKRRHSHVQTAVPDAAILSWKLPPFTFRSIIAESLGKCKRIWRILSFFSEVAKEIFLLGGMLYLPRIDFFAVSG